MATHVERKSRFLIAAKLENKKEDSLASQSIKAFYRIPKKILHLQYKGLIIDQENALTTGHPMKSFGVLWSTLSGALTT